MMNQEKIGKFICESRKSVKLTQEQLAEKLGISKNAVSKWERGLNLPDASIMKALCTILNISLNELFAGEKLKESEMQKQSEKNILNILNFTKDKHKKYKLFLVGIVILLILNVIFLGNFVLIKLGYVIDDNLKYTQIYVAGEDNIKGSVDINRFGKISIAFDIGANKYGYAVFKNPKKAFKTLKKDYKDGIKLIQKEFNLLPLSNFNYKDYKTFGWQVTTGTNKQKEQARFVSSFMDIYENSFN